MKNHIQTAMPRVSELTDAELQAISGGLNPQPLPPRLAHSFLFSNAAVRAFQATFA
jgi:bacteriocin-like protein